MEFIERMRTIQNSILEFLDDEDDEDSQYLNNIISLLNYQKTQIDISELRSTLHLISGIINNHHRGPFFYNKIKKIFCILKEQIKQTFSNDQIFNIFKENKVAILILLEENIMTIDDNMSKTLYFYGNFYYTEIHTFIQKYDETLTIEIPEDYKEKRRIGENDFYICSIIRDDNVVEFIEYFNKHPHKVSLTMTIPSSIYETNEFLLNRKTTLIEYSAFFGSIQIFRFLFQNNVSLNDSLWAYAIHGRNAELIHLLEENVTPPDFKYIYFYEESIKCYNDDFALYFKNNYINVYKPYYISYGFEHYNFNFIPIEKNEPLCFFYAVQNDLYKLVEYYKDIKGLDINKREKFILNKSVLKTAFDDDYIDIFNYLLELPNIKIGCKCFEHCTKLKQIVIPSTITEIGQRSFQYCTKLEEITIPSSVTSIRYCAFIECKSLNEIKIPSSVTVIEGRAFCNCKSLKEFEIPPLVKSIENNTFDGCSSLEKIAIHPSIESIGDYAFYNCSSLTEITIPSLVKSIGVGAFYNCSSLINVSFDLPSSLKVIKASTFEKCTSLKIIHIPKSIKSIMRFAFKKCVSLNEVYVHSKLEIFKPSVFKFVYHLIIFRHHAK